MEWDPTERDAWVADAERWIGQINGVLQCKIDLDDGGEVTGVHVVAGMEREPRHIVRDVEGLLKARLDLDVYYKKIGVVQVVDNGALTEIELADEPIAAPAAAPPPVATVPQQTHAPAAATAVATEEPAHPSAGPAAPEAEPAAPARPALLVAEGLGLRVRCAGVGVTASDTVVGAEVQLVAGEASATGRREGPNHAGSDVVQVAEATLAALAGLISDPLLLHLHEVRLESVGAQTVVLAAVDLVEGRRTETLYGTCAAGHNRQQAIVHAVLDALNRRLSLLCLRESAAGP